MTSKQKIHIVGGGFSGLMAAFFLSHQGHEIVVSEAQNWGGLLQNQKTPWGWAEGGANGFLRTDLLEKVASQIGCELLSPKPTAKKRWIANEKPERLPVTVPQLIRGGGHFFWMKARGSLRPRQSELLSVWAERIVGKPLANRLLLPAVQGIYGTDSRRLSAGLVVNPLLKKNRAKRRGLAAPAGTMSEWTDKMLLHLRSRHVELREEKLALIPDAGRVILATSAAAKAELLREPAPKAAALFAQMQTLPMVSVTAFFQKTAADWQGFGVLFHPDFDWRASGVLFPNQIFEGRSEFKSERWFFPRSEILTKSDDEIRQVIEEERGKLGWKNSFVGMHVHRWPRALPFYSLEHEKLLAQNFELPGRLHLLGNEMGEIGLTSLAEKAKALAFEIGEVRG